MKIGVVFPQTEIGPDPAVIRDYAQTAEGLGYSHILSYDHVLGASTEHRPDWKGPYSSDTAFHEPFVLYGYLAAVTEKVGLVTGVIILPQRQTALVAKQAAEVDVLSGGRLRFGIGIGWNEVEYIALGENFRNRAKRMEEQVVVLRKLWTDPVVDFRGQWHEIPEAGIKPLPVQRPIPIWMGGHAEAVLERVARMGDGWFPQMRAEAAVDSVKKLRELTAQAGRDPKSVGIEARLNLRTVDPTAWHQQVEAWQSLDIDYISINTMGMGLDSPLAHISMIEQVAKELGVGMS